MRLVKYDAAKNALALISSKDEILEFRNKAIALEAYAYQCKDPTLVENAIKVRKRISWQASREGGAMKPHQRPPSLWHSWAF
jgi:hypothetical protein